MNEDTCVEAVAHMVRVCLRKNPDCGYIRHILTREGDTPIHVRITEIMQAHLPTLPDEGD